MELDDAILPHECQVLPLGWCVFWHLIYDAHLDVPLEPLLNLLLPVDGDPVGDGVTGEGCPRLDSLR